MCSDCFKVKDYKKMQIIAVCPDCNYCWLLDINAADRRIKCKNCSNLFKIPQIDEMQKAIDIVKISTQKVLVDKNGNTYA